MSEHVPFAAVRETHIGVVFLVGDRVYKLKKPVNLGFLDFSTPERRLAACRRGDAARCRPGHRPVRRDVLSRVLIGAGPVLVTSLLAATLGSSAGVLIGLGAALAGARRRWTEGAMLRPLDAIAALPPLLVLLLILTTQPGRVGIVLAVACG